MRVLLDTNVLVSALLSPDGPPGLIYAAVRAGVFELIVNDALLTEVEQVLARPKIRKYVAAEASAGFLASLRQIAVMVEHIEGALTHASDALASPDPDDEFLLGLVRDGRPDFFVTGDRALLALASTRTTLVVSPSDLQLVLEELVGPSG